MRKICVVVLLSVGIYTTLAAGDIRTFGTFAPSEYVETNTASWVYQKLKIGWFRAQGITGKGIKVAIVENGCATAPGVLEATRERDAVVKDFHGTGVASVLGGKRFGIAPDAEMHIYSAAHQTIPAVIRKAADDGMRILNASFGTYTDAPEGMATHASEDLAAEIRAAVDYAWEKGMLIIAGNGNQFNNEALGQPSDNPRVLSVGGLEKSGVPSTDLSYNWRRDVLAPAKDVPLLNESLVQTQYSGTSFAAPIACGIAALVLQQAPDLTPGELRQYLIDTADFPEGRYSDGWREKDRVHAYGDVRPSLVRHPRRESELARRTASRIPIESITLDMPEATWDETFGGWVLKVAPRTPITLKFTVTPANTTDFPQCYVGNTMILSSIDRDNVTTLTPNAMTIGGKTLTTDFGVLEVIDSTCRRWLKLKLKTR